MKDEYISIPEFAKRAGVSHQAIYKRMDKDLQPWLQVADGKKSLNIRALSLFESEKSATEVATLVATVNLLQKTVELLEKELSLKNDEIRELHSRLKETSQIAANAQQLHAVDLMPEKLTAAVDESGEAVINPEPAQPAEKKKKLWQFWK